MSDRPLEDWLGREETVRTTASLTIAHMLAGAMSGQSMLELSDGDPLPALWHWALFHPLVPMAQIGRDGHPELGGFLPPVPLERRMWAGGRVLYHGGISIGDQITRHSRIDKIEERQGSSGRMVFVTVAHRVEAGNSLAITEEQDIVYIAMPQSYRPPKQIPAPENASFESHVAIDKVRLFRYSAATFNAHRIHFDLPYAREVEKYPGLVVHGPMQATFLIAAAIDYKGSTPNQFTYRGVHPMFHDHDMRVIGVDAGDGSLELCTAAPLDRGGHRGMQAKALWS